MAPSFLVALIAGFGIMSAFGDEASLYKGEFLKKADSVFSHFRIYKTGAKGEAHLHLVSGEKVCRYLLDSFREEVSGTRRTVRFQGSKVECELQRAGTVIGVVEIAQDKQSGRVRLVGDGRSVDLHVQRASQ